MYNDFKLNFKNNKFIDAIIEEMENKKINEFTFKYSFAGGYILKFIKHEEYIFNSINIFNKEICKELLKKLGINEPFQICRKYKTQKIHSITLDKINKRIDHNKKLELIKIYYDSQPTYFNVNIEDSYLFLIKNLTNRYESIILLKKELNNIINRSFEELAKTKYLNLYLWSVKQ